MSSLRKKFWIVVFLIISWFDLAQGQSQTRTISGYVLEAESGQPIEGADISLVGNVGKRDDVSDSRGAFNIPLVHVSNGDVIEIRVSKSGYQQYHEKISVSDLALKITLHKNTAGPKHGSAHLFSIDVTLAAVLPDIWVVGPSPVNDSLVHVDLLVMVNIVNLQSKAAAISHFSMALKRKSGGWMPLNRIQSVGTSLFPYLGPMNRAGRWKFSPPDLETVLGPEANVGPGVTIRGTGLFRYSDPKYCLPAGEPLTLRITLGDTIHHFEVFEMTTAKAPIDDPDSLGGDLALKFEGDLKDLTKLKGADKPDPCSANP